MQDLTGWLLMIFSFGIVLMWKHLRGDTKMVQTIWLCMVLHHAVALLNAYFSTVIGANDDADKVHSIGVELAALTEPEWVYGSGQVIYTQFLGFFYRTFGTSLLLGEELSVLAFTLSCVVLVKLVDILDLKRFRVGIVLLFGLLPSAIIFRSVTLRESWQTLFFLLSVYWAIRLRNRPSILITSFLLMSAFCLALLHHGLSRYAVYLILISLCWGVFAGKRHVCRSRSIRFLLVGLLVVCVIMLAQKMGWYMTLGQGLEGVENFRQNAATISGRTTYGVVLDTSSVLGFVKTILLVFVYYMFAPFPWHVEKIIDIYAMLESMLRFVLLFFAVFSWRRSSGEVRSYYGFLLIIFFGMELVWALGTINWGTAIRHHVPGYSVLALLGVPGLILFMRKLHFGIFGLRNDNTMRLK